MIDLLNELRRIKNKSAAETFDPAEDSLEAISSAYISFWGTTDANGSALGTTIVCGALAAEPSFTGLAVKIVDGDAAGLVKTISGHPAGTNTLTVASPFTDNTGAVVQIVTGTRFVILSASGGGSLAPILAPSIGLWMFGECDPAMAASTTVLLLTNLAGFPDDIFNDEFYVQVIHNINAIGAAPEGEIRQVTDYVGATGTFTCNAFTANVEAGDLVCVIHESLITPGLEVLSTIVNAIFDLVNAGLVTTETGGTILTTGPGTEDDIYINNAPAGVYKPLKVMIDFSVFVRGAENHGSQATETIVLRTYYRIYPGGNLIKKDEVTLAGARDPALINVELEPNRYGCSVTMERIAGNARYYDWSCVYDA